MKNQVGKLIRQSDQAEKWKKKKKNDLNVLIAYD